MEDQEPVQLIVMGNTMTNCQEIEGIFDLKGSIINREVKTYKSKTSTLKDVNLLRLNKRKGWMRWREEDVRMIMSELRKDTALLKEFNLMDYSLLLTVTRNTMY